MANTVELKVPKLGDFRDVPVVEVNIVVGGEVKKDEPVVSLESEKAVIEVPSPYSGRVASVAVKAGDTVSEGDTLGTLELVDGVEPESAHAGASGTKAPPTAAPAVQPVAAQPVAAQAAVAAVPAVTRDVPVSASSAAAAHTAHTLAQAPATQEAGGKKPHASPPVRLLARELGVDLAGVAGTGPSDRIRATDLKAAVRASLLAGAAPAGTEAKFSIPVDVEAFRKYGEVEILPLSRIKKLSGPRLQESWQVIPHVTQFEEADITQLEEFRKRANRSLEAEGIKLTVLAFAVRAAVKALIKYPLFNSSIIPGRNEFAVKKYYNIGFAASTEAGLVVPCIKNADRKGLAEIGGEIRELSEKAAQGKLSLDEMTGATFTISSLGSIGGTAFTPIINPPEVAILGLSRATMKPFWDACTESFLPRLILPFSLSYDHRAVDGAEAARFCVYLSGLFSEVSALFM